MFWADTLPRDINKFKQVMDEVYGPYKPGGEWRPKPYAEGKGRYLWTDAFGVCNFLTLYSETGDNRYMEQAEALIRDVHNVLGRTRDGSARLPGATDAEQLRGGLRIGKADPEGTPDGDGQYFHYLTKWMFALNRMSLARNGPHYNDWAISLAQAVYPRFVYGRASPRPRMFWKMSIDLTRPAVPSEGNLDPFDGFVTYRLLRDTQQRFAEEAGKKGGDVLAAEIDELHRIVRSKAPGYNSTDPLDLGEALWLAHWYPDEPWAQAVTTKSLRNLEALCAKGYFSMSERSRLAFREFGTTIGVQVNRASGEQWRQRVLEIHEFWGASRERLFSRDHDITPVMFCTSLLPGAFDKEYSRTKLEGRGRKGKAPAVEP